MPLFEAARVPPRLPPLLVLATTAILIFIGTLMPAALKDSAHAALGSELPWPALAHVILFGVLAASPVFGRGRAGTWRALLLALLLALATESLQTLVPGRHPALRDVLIDLGGALLGRLLWLRASEAPARRPG
ncbi:VanZ family protein [Ramlibacter sp. AW1]|uniref:VanZ family protein n=1 Tax=Ramlibacter aurantiacus TaxID=2801330 RepID=A0A936ZMI2_9BURK|nr:VanZ family protein [Ramlibacter aurantiacus]MBL0422908.1 VanZ family protein [Ramlibacter aurantiacus]